MNKSSFRVTFVETIEYNIDIESECDLEEEVIREVFDFYNAHPDDVIIKRDISREVAYNDDINFIVPKIEIFKEYKDSKVEVVKNEI